MPVCVGACWCVLAVRAAVINEDGGVASRGPRRLAPSECHRREQIYSDVPSAPVACLMTYSENLREDGGQTAAGRVVRGGGRKGEWLICRCFSQKNAVISVVKLSPGFAFTDWLELVGCFARRVTQKGFLLASAGS